MRSGQNRFVVPPTTQLCFKLRTQCLSHCSMTSGTKYFSRVLHNSSLVILSLGIFRVSFKIFSVAKVLRKRCTSGWRLRPCLSYLSCTRHLWLPKGTGGEAINPSVPTLAQRPGLTIKEALARSAVGDLARFRLTWMPRPVHSLE